MSKKFVYAVAKGHEPGIYNSWEECQKQTNGYSKPVFKKFKTKIEAENFIEEHEGNTDLIIDDYELEIESDLKKDRVVAFTDGSYKGGNNPVAGYGCFIITPEGNEHEISNIVHTEKYIGTNNIAAEVFGVLESLKWVLSNEYTSVVIYHDLELIGKWADGSNKASSEVGQLFLRELNNKYKIALDIIFKWVPSHSNIEQNEKADTLAKNAVFRQIPVSKYGKNSFMGRGVDKKRIDDIIEKFKSYSDVDHSKTENNDILERHVLIFNNEKLTVTYFKTKGTTLLQGKVESLFSEFLSMYTLHLDDFNMIRAYSDSFKHTIRDTEINNKIAGYSLPNDYPSDIITLLKQSHILLGLNRTEHDYSHYTMPSFRALEGHFKYLAAKEGVTVPLYKNIGSFFYFCKKENYPKWKEKDSQAKKLAESSSSDKLHDIQIFLNSTRNSLSHFGSVTEEGKGSTMMIENVEEAREIINETINLIVN